MAIGPENRPGFNDIGNVGVCVEFPSGARWEGSGTIPRCNTIAFVGGSVRGRASYVPFDISLRGVCRPYYALVISKTMQTSCN